MVPPGDIGPVPIWVGVYVLLLLTLAVGGYVFYYRVIHLVLQGRRETAIRPAHGTVERGGLNRAGAEEGPAEGTLRRLRGDWDTPPSSGDSSPFLLSYAIFIFGASVWRPFPEWLLTETGAMVYSSYLDILAAVLLVVLAWAAVRRWVVQPRRFKLRPDPKTPTQ